MIRNREDIKKHDWDTIPEQYTVLSEKQLITHLGTVADEIFSNGSHSMYGHSLLEELMNAVYDLANSKGIKIHTPAYNEKD